MGNLERLINRQYMYSNLGWAFTCVFVWSLWYILKCPHLFLTCFVDNNYLDRKLIITLWHILHYVKIIERTMQQSENVKYNYYQNLLNWSKSYKRILACSQIRLSEYKGVNEKDYTEANYNTIPQQRILYLFQMSIFL